MTIQMANRLVALRKAAGLSQDAVAEKIGVSRQAVSKWERAEAAPDTDNLIALANLYNISVDELLNNTNTSNEGKPKAESTIDINLPFIKVRLGNTDGDEPHVNVYRKKHKKNSKNADGTNESLNDDEADDIEVEILGDDDSDHDFEYTYKSDNKKGSLFMKFPYPILTVIAYLVMGFVFHLWHPGWIVFLSIPVYYWIGHAIVKRRIPNISVSFLITAAYLIMGIGWGMWHPWWIMFLAIPIFDFIINAIKKRD